MMLSEGEQRTTKTGRLTTPFPRVDLTTHRRVLNTLKRVRAWLIENAVAEADARGDELAGRLFKSENPARLPRASQDAMHNYLWGD